MDAAHDLREHRLSPGGWLQAESTARCPPGRGPAYPDAPRSIRTAVEAQRWRCGLRADSPGVAQLRAAIEQRADGDGLVRLRSGRRYTAVVSWEPRSTI